MAPTMKDLPGYSLGSATATYDERDVMLYALAVGAHASELELVYERDLRVLSTFALPIGLWAVERAGALGAYDGGGALHVGQDLTMRRPLPASGAIEMSGTVTHVWDKGSAALVEVEVSSDYFVATYVLFVAGAGGFGGDRGPASATAPTEGEPTWTTRVATTLDQAALYRLTGDRHVLHIDPERARAAGFERPILHGLCTLGAVVLDLARVTGRDATQVASLGARFSAPVLPGATIDLAAWSGESTRYVASVEGVGTVLSGSVAFA